MRHQIETLTVTRQQKAGRHLSATRYLVVGLLSILCWSGALGQAQAQWTDSGTYLRTGDNVHIGVTSAIAPGKRLEIRDANGNVLRLNRTNATARQWDVNIASTGNLVIRDNNAAADRFTITTTGNVGIGTTSPGATLTVNAVNGLRFYKDGTYNMGLQMGFNTTNNITNLSFRDKTDTSYQDIFMEAKSWRFTYGGNANTALQITNSGNVGIGTTGPSALLQVQRQGSQPVALAVQIGNQTLPAANAQIPSHTTSSSGYKMYTGYRDGAELFYVGNDGSGYFAGTVTGGNIKAQYQDVAEWVPAPAPLPAGTVVVLDTEETNQVIASSHAYDTKVAGVISEMPGLLLGIEAEGKVKVATTGRVKVKVTTANGPIQVGDLLVSSEQPGVAMRSVPIEIQGRKIHSPGTIIGKALEPLAGGEGEILVLLSLQ